MSKIWEPGGWLIARWAYNVFTAVNQVINAVFGGDPDMTMSGRVGITAGTPRELSKCKFCRKLALGICWLLDLVDKGHCKKAAALDADEGKDALW